MNPDPAVQTSDRPSENLAGPPSRVTPVIFREQNLRRLLASLAVSQIGDWLYNVALLVAVYQQSHSGAWLAITTGARILPMVVAGPLGGILADRVDRRRLMIAADLLRAALMMLFAAVFFFDLPALFIPVLAALSSLAGVPYATCVAATVPRLVSDDDLPAANSARSVIGEASVVLGPLLGAAALLLGSTALTFVINAASFAIAGLLVASIRGDVFTPPRTGLQTSLTGDLGAGISALRAHPQAWRAAGADVLGSAVYGALAVLLLLFASEVGGDDSGYGLLLAASGGGGVLAALAASSVMRMASDRVLIIAGLLATAAALVGLGLLVAAPLFPLALVAAAIAGGAGVLVEIQADTSLQRQIPEEVFGRAYGFVLPACFAAIILGSAAAPVLDDILGLGGAFISVGVLAAGYALWVAFPERAASGKLGA